MGEGCSASVTLPERLEQPRPRWGWGHNNINYKSCPSRFQFSKCLQHWGTGAPRLAVSSLPLISFTTNEAASQGTGQLSHHPQNRVSPVPGQGCCSGGCDRGSRVLPLLPPCLGTELGTSPQSLQLAPLVF